MVDLESREPCAVNGDPKHEPRLRIVVVRDKLQFKRPPLVRHALDSRSCQRRLAVCLERHVDLRALCVLRRRTIPRAQRNAKVVHHALLDAHAEVALVGDARAHASAHGHTVPVVCVRAGLVAQKALRVADGVPVFQRQLAAPSVAVLEGAVANHLGIDASVERKVDVLEEEPPEVGRRLAHHSGRIDRDHVDGRRRRRDALLRRGDERDRAVWVAHIALDARRAAAVRAALERGVVVEHVPLALEEHAAAVDRAGSLGAVHDLPAVLPRTVYRLRRRVSPVLGNAARRVFEIVRVAELVYPRRLLEVRVDGLARPRSPRLLERLAERGLLHQPRDWLHFRGELDHVLLQLRVPASRRPAAVAPEEIRLAVVVDEDGRIDISRAGPDERLSDRIRPRTLRSIRNGNADAVAARIESVHRDIPVPLPVALDRLARPRAVVAERPLENGRRHHRTKVLPVLEILRAHHAPVAHRIAARIWLVVSGEYVEPIPVDDSRGIGREARLHDRVRSVGRERRVVARRNAKVVEVGETADALLGRREAAESEAVADEVRNRVDEVERIAERRPSLPVERIVELALVGRRWNPSVVKIVAWSEIAHRLEPHLRRAVRQRNLLPLAHCAVDADVLLVARGHHVGRPEDKLPLPAANTDRGKSVKPLQKRKPRDIAFLEA